MDQTDGKPGQQIYFHNLWRNYIVVSVQDGPLLKNSSSVTRTVVWEYIILYYTYRILQPLMFSIKVLPVEAYILFKRKCLCSN